MGRCCDVSKYLPSILIGALVLSSVNFCSRLCVETTLVLSCSHGASVPFNLLTSSLQI